MTPYAPSSLAIETAIAGQIGSAGFFQRVAEEIARGLYPNLPLSPFGRRSDDKPVAGWPDAYLACEGRALIAIEATTAADARTLHWPKDLVNLQAKLEPGDRGGLIWIAWCNPRSATDGERMRQQVVELGLPPENVHILFKKDVCVRLRAPIHARFWINDLRLKVTSAPFIRVEEVLARAAYRRGPGVFPLAEDYEAGRVHAPGILPKIEQAIADEGSALVVGHGAAGKTTLGMLLSYRPQHRHSQTYYLDLTNGSADVTFSERAAEAMAAIADSGVLFLIDNAHLDPETGASLFSHWQTFGAGSKLLILTRRIRAKPQAWSTEPELEAIPTSYFDLVVTPADLEGIYRRHHLTHKKNPPSGVTPAVLRAWHRLFGGDLMSFSSAVLGLLERSGQPTELGPSDASDYVRNRYLNDLEGTERAALLDLAAVAEIEGIVPVEALGEDVFRKSIRRGLVWTELLGRSPSYAHYRLAHPGLGTLLRQAADLSAESRDARCRVLSDHPYSCAVLASRLLKGGAEAEASALVKALWNGSKWPKGSTGLHWFRFPLLKAIELDLVKPDEIRERLHLWIARPGASDAIADQALASPLNYIQTFLAATQKEFPEIAEVVRTGLAANPATLLTRALSTPHLLPSFLLFLHQNLPEVETRLRTDLAENADRVASAVMAMRLNEIAHFLDSLGGELPAVVAIIADRMLSEPEEMAGRALATPLHLLVQFLTTAKRLMPAADSRLEVELLARAEELISRTRATPINLLENFLSYVQRERPAIAESIAQGLSSHGDEIVTGAISMPLAAIPGFLTVCASLMPDIELAVRERLESKGHHVAGLISQIPATPPDQLASFLPFARKHMPKLAQTLVEAMLREPILGAVAERWLKYGPGNLAALFKQEGELTEILKAVDAAECKHEWGRRRHAQPNWFRNLAMLCRGVGRDDLAGIAAESVIRRSSAEDFSSSAMTILHVSSILTASHGCDAEEVQAFLTRCLPANWFRAQFDSISTRLTALAASTWPVALDDRDWIRAIFRHPALARRVAASQPRYTALPRETAEWLQSLSALRLLDDRSLDLCLRPPLRVASALLLLFQGDGTQDVERIRVSLWAGLREWCHLSGDQPRVDAKQGQSMLVQMQAASPNAGARARALDMVMIDWLERCRDHDWRCVADKNSLKAAVDRVCETPRSH